MLVWGTYIIITIFIYLHSQAPALYIIMIVSYYDYTGLLLTSLLLRVHALINQCKLCWNEVLYIDKPLTFNIGLLQLIFHTSVFT